MKTDTNLQLVTVNLNTMKMMKNVKNVVIDVLIVLRKIIVKLVKKTD
jgi:hypothetical protein